MIDFGLKNKLAVVTGGTRGIGSAIAEKLVQVGANVIMTGTTKKPVAFHKNYYAVDFTKDKDVELFSAYLKDQQPDILINNAGINMINPFEEITLDNFLRIQKINVTVPFQLCQAVIAGMKLKKWGRIINISSVFGKISKKERASYSTSKFAIDGMTAALAAEVAEFGILANCVAPGFIETDLTKKVLGEKGMETVRKQIPLQRLGKPEEIAALVAWLVSVENTYISGQHIIIDGGFTRV